MASSIDPLSRLLLEAAFAAAQQGLEAIKNHHQDNHKIVDACNNTEQMLNGALAQLMTL